MIKFCFKLGMYLLFAIAMSLQGGEFTLQLETLPFKYKIYDSLMGPIICKEIATTDQDDKEKLKVLEHQICNFIVKGLLSRTIRLDDLPNSRARLEKKIFFKQLNLGPKKAIKISDNKLLEKTFSYRKIPDQSKTICIIYNDITHDLKELLQKAASNYKEIINDQLFWHTTTLQKKYFLTDIKIKQHDPEKGLLLTSTLYHTLSTDGQFVIKGDFNSIGEMIGATIVCSTLFFICGLIVYLTLHASAEDNQS